MQIVATEQQIKRLERDYSKAAGESVSCDQRGDVIYIYGSELACLRLFHTYRNLPKEKQPTLDYSENLKAWFFCFKLFV